MKVDDYDKLKQLALGEAFKHGVSAKIRVHLDEQKVTDLKSAAVLADDYALTHKKWFQQQQVGFLSSHIGQVTMVVSLKVNPVIRTRGHVQRLKMINLTKLKLNKSFLSSRKDQGVFTARKLDT